MQLPVFCAVCWHIL